MLALVLLDPLKDSPMLALSDRDSLSLGVRSLRSDWDELWLSAIDLLLDSLSDCFVLMDSTTLTDVLAEVLALAEWLTTSLALSFWLVLSTVLLESASLALVL